VNGHAAAAPLISLTNSRRLIAFPEAQTQHRNGSNRQTGSGQVGAGQCPLCAKSGHSALQQRTSLFDHLVSAIKQFSLNDEA
jgi:hypothetical protein